jgi:NAD(P)H-hydrate repair Nnr-like enzyme with NAD(P)H-hydrate dehydratase domain
MYNFQLKPEEKVFLITLGGLINSQEAQKAKEELLKKFKTVNTSDYYLVLDCQELKASAQDMLDQEKKNIELLVKTPFKGRFLIESKTLITNMQAKRIAGTTLSQLTTVHSYEEFTFVTKLHKAG